MTEEELQDLRTLRRRLDYVCLQFGREAKFMPRWKREYARFHRGLEALLGSMEDLEELTRKVVRGINESAVCTCGEMLRNTSVLCGKHPWVKVKTQEEKIEFRKEWDRKVDEGE